MLEECPHCHLTVLASAEGVCPNCRKSVRDRSGSRPDLSRLRIKERAPMPPCCHQCGAHTARMAKVHAADGDAVDSFLWKAFVMLFASFLARVAMHASGEGRRRSVTMYLPQCESCARTGPPRPIDVEFDEFAMTFLVHVRFKEAVLRGYTTAR
jgi:hypothetical protein